MPEQQYQRVDLQLIAMRDHMLSILEQQKLVSDSKLLLYRFSAAGDFVSRFTTIHSDQVTAVVAGGMGGLPILPLESFKGHKLTYPVGIGDFKDLVEKEFMLKNFRNVAMMLVQGDLDENDSVVESKYITTEEAFSSDSYNYAQAVWINKTFGNLPINRLPQIIDIYHSVGVKDFSYVVMKGEQHRDKYIKPNAAKFFRCVLAKTEQCAEKINQIMAKIDYSQK
ncbi:MAG: hypothetical protein V2I33_01075 [Kangiellaceae bacterium]|nr:hypothetical protein [Kangiellaceae bacterium]